VRTESDSGYMDPSRCGEGTDACTPIRGDWNVIELTATSTGKP